MKTPLSIFVLFTLILNAPIMAQDDIRPKKLKEQHFAPKVTKPADEWKARLTPLQYEVTRNKGTERPFTGQYFDFYEKGNYYCVNCGSLLFNSESNQGVVGRVLMMW